MNVFRLKTNAIFECGKMQILFVFFTIYLFSIILTLFYPPPPLHNYLTINELAQNSLIRFYCISLLLTKAGSIYSLFKRKKRD
jgi:hypothetical protein